MPEPLTVYQIALNVLLSISASGIYDILKIGLKNFNRLSNKEKEKQLNLIKADLIKNLEEVIEKDSIQQNLSPDVKNEVLKLILEIVKDYDGAFDGSDKKEFEKFFNSKISELKSYSLNIQNSTDSKQAGRDIDDKSINIKDSKNVNININQLPIPILLLVLLIFTIVVGLSLFFYFSTNSKSSGLNQNRKVELKKEPKELTSSFSFDEDRYIWRQRDINEIDRYIKKGKNVLLYGEGGVGKTTLAKMYYYSKFKNGEFDYFGFISLSNDRDKPTLFTESIISQLEKGLGLDLSRVKNLNEKFNIVLNKLKELKGKKLIVIDNIYSFKDKYQRGNTDLKKLNAFLGLSKFGYRIILVSRENIKLDGVKNIKVKNLGKTEAKLLFLKSYIEADPFLSEKISTKGIFRGNLKENLNRLLKNRLIKPKISNEKLEELLKLVNYNTLLTEVLGKLFVNFDSLDELIGKIKKVGVREETRTEKELKENFDRIFSLSIQYLEDWEKEYLILFLLLPTNTNIPVEILYQAGDKEKIKEFINDLAKKSLIRKEIATDKNGLKESVITHDLLKEYLRNIYLKEGHKILNLQKEEFYEKVFSIAKDFIKGLTKKYLEEASNDAKKSAVLWNSGKVKILESIGDSLIDLRDFKEFFYTEEVIDYLYRLGTIFLHMSYLEKGIEFHRTALEIGKEIFDKYNPKIANSYNELGLLYHDKGEYDKAEKYYKKALEILERIYKDKDHPYLATDYNNLGYLYKAKGDFTKAEEYFRKAEEVRKRFREKNKH
ncbi:MAG: hypothetical protein DSY60_05875 [Persephonella sp.]|nr:MAG: hypothetical protein DSY60_05875 [Persephonella sp.]